ncbi:CMP-N-acetylneuraminate-poly-alpha-2,8-sialyltransferase-like [Glandiceps talaboti]
MLMDVKKWIFMVAVLVCSIVTIVFIEKNEKLVTIIASYSPFPSSGNLKSHLRRQGRFDPCGECPDNIKFVNSLKELRGNTSLYFNLETSLAIYRDHVQPGKMKLHQRYWPIRATTRGIFRDYFDDNFYTLKPQESCAIVGSSGILKDSKCGKEIDSHDFIMRMNLAVVKGFEEDVGRNTNLTAVNHFAIHFLNTYLHNPKKNPKVKKNRRYLTALEHLNGSIVWFPYNMSAHTLLMDHANSKITYILNETLGKRNFTYRVAYAPVPVWPQLTNRFWNKTGSSEGFVMLTIATLFCKNIHMYGFWPFSTDSDGSDVSHHYYEKIKYRKRKKTMPREFSILQDLHRRRVITLVTDKCM